MTSELSKKVYWEKESLRSMIAEETVHWWMQNGVVTHLHDLTKVKEELMRCLNNLAMP